MNTMRDEGRSKSYGMDNASDRYAEAALDQDDQRWLASRFADRDSVSVRIQVATDTDTQGHMAAIETPAVHVRIASDEIDLEGHAFTLHFPTVIDADAFKRGVAAGAISATLLLGGIGAVAVSQSHGATTADQPAAAAPAAHPKAPAPQPVINVRWGGRAIPE